MNANTASNTNSPSTIRPNSRCDFWWFLRLEQDSRSCWNENEKLEKKKTNSKRISSLITMKTYQLADFRRDILICNWWFYRLLLFAHSIQWTTKFGANSVTSFSCHFSKYPAILETLDHTLRFVQIPTSKYESVVHIGNIWHNFFFIFFDRFFIASIVSNPNSSHSNKYSQSIGFIHFLRISWAIEGMRRNVSKILEKPLPLFIVQFGVFMVIGAINRVSMTL